LEKSAVLLKAKKTDLITLLRGLVSSFTSLAEQKNIYLKFNSFIDELICWVDVDKFEKIINNLLLNALKFTADGGKVVVKVEEILRNEKPAAEIQISDTGISIPPKKLDKIFDRYFQVEDSTQRSHGGSGIGLALVKEFVELHKWAILVESEQGKGTRFTIKIPLQDDYLEPFEKIETVPDEIKSETKIDARDDIKLKSIKKNNKVEANRKNQQSSKKKQSLLIVDDSEDVRTYLSNLLENNFCISEAINGEEGITTATESMPDLIISDVMMPSMDGLEFCRRIKNEWQTSDIPVILLTAKASFESKLEGLEIGADDYLTKPFESRELLIRINNLLEQRKRLKEKFSKNLDPLAGVKKLNSADEEFINKTLKMIEENIDKVNFNTEKLASQLFMSRAKLHRKIVSITGQAPGEFIRTIKLNRAAKHLIEGNLSVTQIAYEIGFSSPAQFTRAFSKQFNCLPSEYSLSYKS
jgi:DNA-binding response OmpR family regulator